MQTFSYELGTPYPPHHEAEQALQQMFYGGNVFRGHKLVTQTLSSEFLLHFSFLHQLKHNLWRIFPKPADGEENTQAWIKKGSVWYVNANCTTVIQKGSPKGQYEENPSNGQKFIH